MYEKLCWKARNILHCTIFIRWLTKRKSSISVDLERNYCGKLKALMILINKRCDGIELNCVLIVITIAMIPIQGQTYTRDDYWHIKHVLSISEALHNLIFTGIDMEHCYEVHTMNYIMHLCQCEMIWSNIFFVSKMCNFIVSTSQNVSNYNWTSPMLNVNKTENNSIFIVSNAFVNLVQFTWHCID